MTELEITRKVIDVRPPPLPIKRR